MFIRNRLERLFDLSNRYQPVISSILTILGGIYYIVSMSDFRFESAFEMADAPANRTNQEVSIMAKRIILSDDFSGKEDESVATYTFMDRSGKFYQIDLSSDSILKFDRALKAFISAGREVTRVTALAGSNGSKASVDQTADIRVWARQNGYQVGDRGRMPEEAIAAYNAAHATN